MDDRRFDELTRLLGSSAPRRVVNTLLGSGLIGGALAIIGWTDAEAKKKRGKKKNKNRNKKRKCLVGQRRCRDRRCHGCCSNADCGGNECELGVCRDCPRNERPCRGGCIPETNCCTDDECDGDQTCVDGVCGCRANERRCEGACIPVEYCCTSDDCDGAPCEDGQCQCAAGQRDCHGRCIPDDACCTSPDCAPCETCQSDRCVSFCPAGQTCQDGACGCPSNQQLCRGECIPETSCCRTSDCGMHEVCDDGSCACEPDFEECEGECIPESGCCTSADCDPGEFCVEQECVTGQGTCDTGADRCTEIGAGCNGSNCLCMTTTAGQTRCGAASGLTPCNSCTSDADCATLLPAVPGAFCVQATGPLCPGDCTGFCVAPCPQ